MNETHVPHNRMIVVELSGQVLADWLEDLQRGMTPPSIVRIAVETWPGESTYLKFKCDEGMWSPPFTAADGATVRAEILVPEMEQ